MNDLLGKPQVKSSKLGPDKFSVGYVCTDPNSLTLDWVNAKEDIVKNCNRDQSLALTEAAKFCEAKNLKFKKINQDVFSLRQYSYNSPCHVCEPIDLHYTINFECIKNE